jgi:hypothetical protein
VERENFALESMDHAYQPAARPAAQEHPEHLGKDPVCGMSVNPTSAK